MSSSCAETGVGMVEHLRGLKFPPALLTRNLLYVGGQCGRLAAAVNVIGATAEKVPSKARWLPSTEGTWVDWHSLEGPREYFAISKAQPFPHTGRAREWQMACR